MNVNEERFRQALKERTMEEEKNRWIRAFNRLDAAIRKHAEAKEKSGFADEVDEALHHAHEAILKDTIREGSRYRPRSSESKP